jgi:hypothetical protein
MATQFVMKDQSVLPCDQVGDHARSAARLAVELR